jgi:hypothetical protein
MMLGVSKFMEITNNSAGTFHHSTRFPLAHGRPFTNHQSLITNHHLLTTDY